MFTSHFAINLGCSSHKKIWCFAATSLNGETPVQVACGLNEDDLAPPPQTPRIEPERMCQDKWHLPPPATSLLLDEPCLIMAKLCNIHGFCLSAQVGTAKLRYSPGRLRWLRILVEPGQVLPIWNCKPSWRAQRSQRHKHLIQYEHLLYSTPNYAGD